MKRGYSELSQISCAEAVARFNDFMDDYISSNAKQELLFHISKCRQCMDRLEFERMLKSKLYELSKFQYHEHTIRKIEKLIATF